MTQKMTPQVLLAVCIARALHDRDPKFLPALQTAVQTFRKQPELHSYYADEILAEFASALAETRNFVKSSDS